MRPSRGTHQSSVLSEMSSQFHDEWRAAPGRFFIESCAESGVARRHLVFGPSPLTTGCRPIVLVTTPPQPASKARVMFDSDSVGGAEASRKGFSNRSPVNVKDRFVAIGGTIIPERRLQSPALRGPHAQTSRRRPDSGIYPAHRAL